MAALLFYVGLGGLLTLEEAGLFLLPGDITLVAGGMRSAQGESMLLISWLVAATGMVIGASLLFHGVARSKHSRRLMPRRVNRLIRRHGIWGVGLARLIPGLRNATVFAGASARMPYRRFLCGLIPAALVWSGFLLTLGWCGGAAMLSAFGAMHHSSMLKVISAGLLLAAASFVVWRLWSKRSHPVVQSQSKAA